MTELGRHGLESRHLRGAGVRVIVHHQQHHQLPKIDRAACGSGWPGHAAAAHVSEIAPTAIPGFEARVRNVRSAHQRCPRSGP